MVAKNDLPANTLGELVTWMKANPGKINFVNQNAAANVTGVMFENLTKQKVQFIPYRGAGPAMTDLVSGTVDLLVVQGAVALPQIRAGKIKALANLSPQRSASMPDIPTSDETGVPGLYMSGWFGFWAPKGTPKDVIAKLNAATVEALADPAIQKRFTELGSTSLRARSRRRKAWPRSRRPRSTNGGRSSSRPGSACRRSNLAGLGCLTHPSLRGAMSDEEIHFCTRRYGLLRLRLQCRARQAGTCRRMMVSKASRSSHRRYPDKSTRSTAFYGSTTA